MKKLKQLTQAEVKALISNQLSEYIWASDTEIEKWFSNGYVIGNEEFAVVAVPILADTLLCKAVKSAAAQLVKQNTLVAVAIGKFDSYLKLATKAKSVISTETEIILVLPVKAEYNLSPVFEMGFVLRLIRPLNNLRPFYIFTLSINDKKNYNIVKRVYCGDAYLIGKTLEQGYIAVGKADNNLLFAENDICLIK